MVSTAQLAETPVGNPVGVPILVAPDVGMVIAVSSEFMHKVGVEEGFSALQSDLSRYSA